MKNYSPVSKVADPISGKRLKEVFIKGKGLFIRNNVYNVYNSEKDYSQLQKEDLRKIDYSRSA